MMQQGTGEASAYSLGSGTRRSAVVIPRSSAPHRCTCTTRLSAESTTNALAASCARGREHLHTP